MIVAVYNVFNEAATFEESLASIEPHVDRIVVADGPYWDFPHDEPRSTDGTLDIAEAYADELIVRDQPWIGEMTKRNWLLEQVPPNAWMFKVDADEVVSEFDSAALDTTADVVMPKMVHPNGGKDHYVHSLVRKTKGVHYKERDSLYKRGTPISRRRCVRTDDIIVEHYQDSRPPERQAARDRYRRNLQNRGEYV